MTTPTFHVEYVLRVLAQGLDEGEPKELVTITLDAPLMTISPGDTIWPRGLRASGLENHPDPLLYRESLTVKRVHHSMSRFNSENPPVLRHTVELHVDDQAS